MLISAMFGLFLKVDERNGWFVENWKWTEAYILMTTIYAKRGPNILNQFSRLIELWYIKIKNNTLNNRSIWSARPPNVMTVLYQLQCITIDEIVDVCKSLKNNKSTGLDNISYKHVKLHKYLYSLFTLRITNCYIPICWKSSLIIPLFKGGNKVKNDPNAVVYQRFLRKCYHSFDISTTKHSTCISNGLPEIFM